MVIKFLGERFILSIKVQRIYKRIILTIGWKRNYEKRAEPAQQKLLLEDKP